METDDDDIKNSSKLNRVTDLTSDDERIKEDSAGNRYREVKPKEYLILNERRQITRHVNEKQASEVAASQLSRNSPFRIPTTRMEIRTVRKPSTSCVPLPEKLAPIGIHRKFQNTTVNKHYLTEIVKLSPEVVVKEFQSNQNGFIKIMKTCCRDGNIIDNLFSILAKVIRATSTDQYLHLSTTLRESLFLENVAVPHLLSLLGSACQNISTVRSAVSVVIYIANYSLNSVVSFYSILTALSDLIREIRASDVCTSDVAREFDDFDHIKSKIHKLRRMQQKKKRSTEDGMFPPEDYRSVGIVPTHKELISCEIPFLRKNKEFGSYNDLSHYLDVQFRLMREDFVAPLRESITAYKDHMQDIKSGKKKVTDVKIYNEVQIAGTSTSYEGLCHILTFNTSRYKDEVWEHSKRLIYGSLLCLSHDDFETIYLAVVTNRQVADVKLGIVEVRFVCELDTVKRIAEKTFVMVESEAYFEAYRHNLMALQLITDLPFKGYIVDCAEDINAPAYLRQTESVQYDLKLLASEAAVEKQSDEKGGYCKGTDLNQRANKSKEKRYSELENVQVLTDSAWPCKSTLGLDESQYRALKNALIHEFSITQGPPGTGKTYIGLKIARALLTNKKAWSFSDRKQQLLVVCYTNHALDQFLCGIQDFYEGIIVRVGSRSSNEKMQQCSIKTLYKGVSEEIHEESKNLRTLAEETMQRINTLKSRIYSCDRNLQSAAVLKKQIGRFQMSLEKGFHSILENLNKNEKEKKVLKDRQEFIQEWLGLGCFPRQSHMQVQFEKMDSERNLSASGKLAKTELKSDLPARDLNRYYERTGCFSKENIRSYKEAIYSEQETTKAELSRKPNTRNYFLYKDISVMTEGAQKHVKDVWRLTFKQRWKLYKSWVERLKCDLIETLQEYEENYEILCLEIQQSTQEKQKEALKQADVIGMTTTGAAKYYEVLQHIKPKIVIVEEAAEVLEGHIVTSLSEDCEHLILIGDHKQLRPSPTVYQLAKRYNLDISLFERMINNKVTYERLDHQHRMRPEISQIIRLFYPNLKDHDSVLTKSDIRGVLSNVFFISHSNPEDTDEDSNSHSNEYEAKFLVALCRYLLKQEYKPSQITVLTTYSAQMFKIRRLMSKDSEFEGVTVTVVDNYQGEENEIILLSLVRSNASNRVGFIKTENRVNVALSRARNGLFVIGNFEAFAEVAKIWKAIVQLLRKDNRIGASLPLFCMNHNDRELSVKDASDFKNAPEGGCNEDCDARLDCGHVCGLKCHVYDTQHKAYKCEKKCIRVCQNNHPCPKPCFKECGDCQSPVVKTISKCGHAHTMPCFMAASEWKCELVCERTCRYNHKCTKLCFQDCGNCQTEMVKEMPKCGHMQTMPCYMEPVIWKCKAECERTCKNEHKCFKLCNERCGDCQIEMTKEMPKCGHLQRMPCSVEPSMWKCKVPCEDILECGHKCRSKCSGSHKCRIQVTVEFETCGHAIETMCYKRKMIQCERPCEVSLLCGHRCVRKCFEPHTSQCLENVSVALDCGHCILTKCCRKLQPAFVKCREPCEEELPCGHKCKKLCCEPHTSPCLEACKINLQCGHQCKNRCYEPHTMTCLEPCKMNLQCGHQCRNKCYEPHTKICRVRIEKELPCCQRKLRVLCSEDIAEMKCPLPCQEKLECGHPCKNKCSEPHTAFCKNLVKKILSCKHTIEVHCGAYKDDVECLYDCDMVLECGHNCQNLCSEPHTVNCHERINWVCPYGHAALVSCHKSNKTAIKCHCKCRRKLECGHICSGSCSECSGGMMHMTCYYCPSPAKDCYLSCNETLAGIHRNIQECLDTLHTRLTEMNPETDLYKIYKDRLEKSNGNFTEFLHFYKQGYKDLQKELDRLLRVSDAILAKDRTRTVMKQERERKHEVRGLEIADRDRRGQKKHGDINRRRVKQNVVAVNSRLNETKHERLRESGRNKETLANWRQKQAWGHSHRERREGTLGGTKGGKRDEENVMKSGAVAITKEKNNEKDQVQPVRIGVRETETEQRVFTDKKKENRVCERKVKGRESGNVGRQRKNDMKSRNWRLGERNKGKSSDNKETKVLGKGTVGVDIPEAGNTIDLANEGGLTQEDVQGKVCEHGVRGAWRKH